MQEKARNQLSQKCPSYIARGVIPPKMCIRDRVSPEAEHIFGGFPSVVWNRVMLDYYVAGQRLQEIMQYTWQFICNEIDKTGSLIETTYSCYSKERLMALKSPKIELASGDAKRR